MWVAFDGHAVTREEFADDVTRHLEMRGLTASVRQREAILRLIDGGSCVWHAVAVVLQVCCHCVGCR